jgi:hypothetical protein
MPLEVTFKIDNRENFGPIGEVQKAVSEALPGTEFDREPSGAFKSNKAMRPTCNKRSAIGSARFAGRPA